MGKAFQSLRNTGTHRATMARPHVIRRRRLLCLRFKTWSARLFAILTFLLYCDSGLPLLHSTQRAALEALKQTDNAKLLGYCAPLVLPEDIALLMQTNPPPVIAANQIHPFSARDYATASITDLPEAESVPQLNRAITRQATILDPLSDRVPNEVFRHQRLSYYRSV